MLIVCWTAKGGTGTTVVAAAVSLLLAHTDRPVLAVDLAGDLPAVLGVPEPDSRGVGDWLGAAPEVPPAALERLAVDVGSGLRLVPCGAMPATIDHTRWEALAGWLATRDGDVVVDAGLIAPAPLLAAAHRSWLVIRPCYLAMRRAAASPGTADGVVLVHEPGRALRRADVARSVGIDVVAEVPYDPAIARAVDAGLLAARLPAGLRRSLGPVSHAVAA